MDKELKAQLQDTSKTYLNDLFEIPGMDNHNEEGLVFLGANYFAIPSLQEDEEEDEDSEEEEDS
jgi:hypothetical protein